MTADYMTGRNAVAATVYPVISASGCMNVRIEGIGVDGNIGENDVYLDGCRGAGIYLLKLKMPSYGIVMYIISVGGVIIKNNRIGNHHSAGKGIGIYMEKYEKSNLIESNSFNNTAQDIVYEWS